MKAGGVSRNGHEHVFRKDVYTTRRVIDQLSWRPCYPGISADKSFDSLLDKK